MTCIENRFPFPILARDGLIRGDCSHDCRKIPISCAGLNRLEAEEEEASRERISDPLGPEFCVGYREVHDEA